MPRRYSANSLGEAHPRHYGDCATRCQLRDTVPPTPVRLTHRTLERGLVAPSNPPLVTLQGRTMTSGRRERHTVAVSPVRPSPPLQCHAVQYCNHSNAVKHAGMGRRHAYHSTPYGSPSTAPSGLLGDTPVNRYASTLEAAPVQVQGTPRHCDRSKTRQDGRHLYGTVRHTSPCSQIVRHTCKSSSTWSIKGRRSPSPRGTQGQETAHGSLPVLPTILALASITPLGTWRPRLLSRSACSHPTTGTPVQSNIVPRAHLCWTYGPGRNQDKPSVLSCLALTIERWISELITS
jgi:hypothetical protein